MFQADDLIGKAMVGWVGPRNTTTFEVISNGNGYKYNDAYEKNDKAWDNYISRRTSEGVMEGKSTWTNINELEGE